MEVSNYLLIGMILQKLYTLSFPAPTRDVNVDPVRVNYVVQQCLQANSSRGRFFFVKICMSELWGRKENKQICFKTHRSWKYKDHKKRMENSKGIPVIMRFNMNLCTTSWNSLEFTYTYNSEVKKQLKFWTLVFCCHLIWASTDNFAGVDHISHVWKVTLRCLLLWKKILILKPTAIHLLKYDSHNISMTHSEFWVNSFIWSYLVGGFNPFEQYARQNGNLPQIGVNIKNIWVATT